jgi:hypothetical protein
VPDELGYRSRGKSEIPGLGGHRSDPGLIEQHHSCAAPSGAAHINAEVSDRALTSRFSDTVWSARPGTLRVRTRSENASRTTSSTHPAPSRRGRRAQASLFPYDGHWNASGHEVAARLLLPSRPLFDRITRECRGETGLVAGLALVVVCAVFACAFGLVLHSTRVFRPSRSSHRPAPAVGVTFSSAACLDASRRMPALNALRVRGA